MGFGGNQGQVEQSFVLAAKELIQNLGAVVKISSIYQSQALQVDQASERQEDYLNCVVVFDSEKLPLQVLKIISQVELDLGRVRFEKWGSRNIDIDIVAVNSDKYYSEELQVPHPEMHKRSFVLQPLVEVDQNWIHPVFNKTAKELLSELKNPTPCKILTSFPHYEF